MPSHLQKYYNIGISSYFVTSLLVIVHNFSKTARIAKKTNLLARYTRCRLQHSRNYTVGQKTASFYFCNNFVKSPFIWIIIGTHIYPTKFGTKWHQYHQSPVKGVYIIPCEMQHKSVLSRKLKLHHYFLEHVNETSYKVWKCMHLQCKTYYQMFQLSVTVPNLCPQPKSSPINHLINDSLLDAWPTVIQMSPQLINISHRILTDSLLKSGMIGSQRFGFIIEVWRLATKPMALCFDGCVCTVRLPAVLVKLKLVPSLWLYKECKIYGWWEIYWSICVPK